MRAELDALKRRNAALNVTRTLATANAQRGLRTRVHTPTTLAGSQELEYEPPAAATAAACLPLAEAGVSMWIGGPPGAGKSTTAFRLRRYGFMAVDCEDHWTWTRFHHLMGSTEQSRAGSMHWGATMALDAGVSLVMGSCGVPLLLHAPWPVARVVLLPTKAVYTARWRARDQNDSQRHDWEAIQQFIGANPSVIPVSDENETTSVDESLLKLCQAVTGRLLSDREWLCFHCKRSPPTSLRLAEACRSWCDVGYFKTLQNEPNATHSWSVKPFQL